MNITDAQLDISANRKAAKWSRGELMGRVLWSLAQPLFAWSPRPLWAWRRQLLRWFGAEVGKDVHILPSARIFIPWNLSIGDQSSIGDRAIIYTVGKITIGEQTTISQNVHLCAGTHDHTRADLPLVKSPITIGNGVWIAADAYVGPGRTVGNLAIVAARAVVFRDIPEEAVARGNPARLVSNRFEETDNGRLGPSSDL